VSRNAIDAILPLAIDPPPTDIVRVFVGRLELNDLHDGHDFTVARQETGRLPT
jgi:hypothetical protein